MLGFDKIIIWAVFFRNCCQLLLHGIFYFSFIFDYGFFIKNLCGKIAYFDNLKKKSKLGKKTTVFGIIGTPSMTKRQCISARLAS